MKLVLLFDAAHNEYCVLAHNSTPENAEDVVKLNADRGTTIVFEQSVSHREPEAARCRTCREIVRRQASIQPLPKFVRRMS